MEEAQAIAKMHALAALQAGRQWARRMHARVLVLARAGRVRRPRRVALLLVGTWVINAFDLAFTLLATGHRHFVELNPIAASIIGNTPALIAYKILVVAFGSAILLKYRTRLLTEIGCWGICAVYSVLAAIWWKFYLMSS